MKHLIVALALTAVACTAPTSDDESTSSSESAATSASWRTVYRCDDGSVLDVNTNERRELQLVVRNKDAIWRMQHSIECQWSAASCPTNASGEMVFRGRVDRGVFSK